jgi:hypothetical protein
MQIKAKTLLLLSLIPIVVFFSSLYLKEKTGPYYYGHNFDPEYAYLLNSLMILNSQIPYHVDHPGTPLQVLGSLVIQTTFYYQSFLKKNKSPIYASNPSKKGEQDSKTNSNSNQNKVTKQSLNQDVIEKPELYLSCINFLLLLLICFSILIAGITTFLMRRKMYEALFIQLIPSLFLTTIQSNIRVSPEPLCLFGVILFISLLTIYIFHKTIFVGSPQINLSIQKSERIYAIAIGALIALIVTTKIINILLLLFVFILPKTKLRIYTICSFLFFSIFMTLPILSNYKYAFGFWLLAGVSHGTYQKWNVGFLGKFHDIIGNLKSLIFQEPFFFILFLLCLFGYLLIILLKSKIFSTNQESNNQTNELTLLDNFLRLRHLRLNKILIVCILSLSFAFVQLIMAMKHPYARYLLVSMILLGFTLYLEIYSLQLLGLFKRGRVKFLNISSEFRVLPLRNFLWVFCLTILVMICTIQFSLSSAIASIYSLSTEKFHIQIKKEFKEYGAGSSVFYPHDSFKIYALNFGNGYTCAYFSDILSKIYTNQIFYDGYKKTFNQLNGGRKDKDSISECDKRLNSNLPFLSKYEQSLAIKLFFRKGE